MLSHTIAKLLIVDDLPENLLALDALIQGQDREVHQAQSAEAALSLLLEHEFALAILDVQMPGMNGFELAELMRGTEKTRNIPIVFVTAAGREMNYAFKGYESGAVDFLSRSCCWPSCKRRGVNWSMPCACAMTSCRSCPTRCAPRSMA